MNDIENDQGNVLNILSDSVFDKMFISRAELMNLSKTMLVTTPNSKGIDLFRFYNRHPMRIEDGMFWFSDEQNLLQKLRSGGKTDHINELFNQQVKIWSKRFINEDELPKPKQRRKAEFKQSQLKQSKNKKNKSASISPLLKGMIKNVE